MEALSRDIIEKGECVSPDELNISGDALLTLGVSGVVLGDVKRRIYDEVIDGRLKNEYDVLFARAKELAARFTADD